MKDKAWPGLSAKAREMFGKGVQGNPPAGVTGAGKPGGLAFPWFPPFPKRWVEDALGIISARLY